MMDMRFCTVLVLLALGVTQAAGTAGAATDADEPPRYLMVAAANSSAANSKGSVPAKSLRHLFLTASRGGMVTASAGTVLFESDYSESKDALKSGYRRAGQLDGW